VATVLAGLQSDRNAEAPVRHVLLLMTHARYR
jgi:hypothetical protein